MSIDTAVRYREHPSPPRVAADVECFWTLERDGAGAPPSRHRILPDGCADVIVSLTGKAPTTADGSAGPHCRVVGTMTAAATVLHRGRVELVGVRFRPGGASPYFGAPAGELADAVLPLADLWGPAAGLLRERILEARKGTRRIAVFADALTRRSSRSSLEAAPRVRSAGRLLARTAGSVPIPDLAREVGLSTRQLLRRFRDAVGVTPKEAARILRFRHAAERIRDEPGTRLTRIALECAYADQAHLTREFTALAGVPPGAYRRASSPPDGGFLQDGDPSDR